MSLIDNKRNPTMSEEHLAAQINKLSFSNRIPPFVRNVMAKYDAWQKENAVWERENAIWWKEYEARRKEDRISTEQMNLCIEASQKRWTELKREFDALGKRIDALEADRPASGSKIDDLSKGYKELRRKVDTLAESAEERNREIGLLSRREAALSDTLSRLEGDINYIKAVFVVGRKPILIENARKKLMKAVLGVTDLPRDLSWKDFIDQHHTSSPVMLQTYLENHSIDISPLTDKELKVLYDTEEGQDESNEAVYEAFADELQLVVDIEHDEEKKNAI
ncbi:hypothetical protein D9613_008067 [Agrocybe pediades]|uniref:Uncharacterized protein n=1 Tax=Agrocybe pediades TaxID=84607 RepID=A0A8H4VN57_9AGAR|nr:hypothetical protein D9613_008067 [Agrocybe pediades]